MMTTIMMMIKIINNQIMLGGKKKMENLRWRSISVLLDNCRMFFLCFAKKKEMKGKNKQKLDVRILCNQRKQFSMISSNNVSEEIVLPFYIMLCNCINFYISKKKIFERLLFC